MTAEVAILNREAVAIAADSAVTLTGPEGRKIYNTANKLFALSATEPVAVMVYNGTSFGSIPWETVVKEYRRELASTAYTTVEEHAAKFFEYSASLVKYVPVEEQHRQVIMTAWWELDTLRAAVERVVEAAASAGSTMSEDEIRDELLDQVEARIQMLEMAEPCTGISASITGQQIKLVIDDWSAFVDKSLDGLPTNEVIRRRARVMVRSSLRVASPSPWHSGVVIAGFGTDQLFPELSHHLFDGIIAEKVRTRHVDRVQIGEEHSAVIYPFAQKEMVVTFMNGIHPEYRFALEGFIDEKIKLLMSLFGDRVKDVLSTQDRSYLLDTMEQARSDIVNDFQTLSDTFKDYISDPIMSIVEWLPKEELADMAESLVNLTSFKHRVTPEAETVGGPIDVAVISKGDGLVWIRRKHYFAPELNHRYFNRDRNFGGR